MGSPKIKLSITIHARHMKFLGLANMKIKFDKIWDIKMGVTPQTGPPKFQLFNPSCKTHEIFRICKYEEKIQLDKFGSTKIKESCSNTDIKTQNLTTYAGLMKFSGRTK